MQKPLILRCKQTNTAGICLFWASVQNVISFENCAYFRNSDETDIEQCSSPSHSQYVPHHFYSKLRFILLDILCDLLTNCKMLNMYFVGFAVFFNGRSAAGVAGMFTQHRYNRRNAWTVYLLPKSAKENYYIEYFFGCILSQSIADG